MYKTLLVSAAFACISSSVWANEVTLGMPGSEYVFVWKDDNAHTEAIKLIAAGVHKSNPSLVMRLMSCMVKAGTKAVILDAGFASHTIMITDGKDAGCKGDIPVEDVRK